MTLFTLLMTLGFVLIALLLSIWLKLGLEREMVVTTVRSTVQLLIIGYVLKTVFSLQDPIFILLMVFLMIGVATQNVVKRGRGVRGITWRVLVTICITEAVSQGFLMVFDIVPSTPEYIISTSGMIVGNSMIISSLFLDRFKSEVKTRKQEILVLLSLGGTPKQSIYPILKEAIRASMIPSMDSKKTIGLVQLPGIMTGMIIAGADPIQAVRFQLLIVFAFMASSTLTSIILGFLTYPSFFNKNQQLIADYSD
ncbi:iron export ABC transporter permease subunit FetB [Ammoniphilus sp. 3BR4]|uniref:ABC transporter permease n=1 Tax=Ammoniphilus sp. 3BR4 TaxID=3158265 RepID=UPI0034665E5D